MPYVHVNDNPDFECIYHVDIYYVIHRTNYADPAVHIVYAYSQGEKLKYSSEPLKKTSC